MHTAAQVPSIITDRLTLTLMSLMLAWLPPSQPSKALFRVPLRNFPSLSYLKLQLLPTPYNLSLACLFFHISQTSNHHGAPLPPLFSVFSVFLQSPQLACSEQSLASLHALPSVVLPLWSSLCGLYLQIPRAASYNTACKGCASRRINCFKPAWAKHLSLSEGRGLEGWASGYESGCPSKGPRFNSQSPHGGSQLPLILVSAII